MITEGCNLLAKSQKVVFMLKAYVDFYNHVRPHQTLVYKAPAKFEVLYGKEETRDL